MVYEISGTLQGLLPGDLGDLGCESLYRERINNILDLVACENEITDLFRENSAAKSSSDPLKSRSDVSWKRKDIDGSKAILHSSKILQIRQRYYSSYIWKPMTKRQ